MYLKSLTLAGFKSFGKPTVFEFQTPVTAVVGPNGSGKSNIAESVRWVLGEQSMKSLRGKRGEDLIFNGSDRTSRLGRAEVKLVFDNSRKQFPFEFDDVVISRRVHRDGSNEYLLNGSVVRLKDIFELLAKVGIGSTQHHIISQGEVDRILWADPHERQEMIEEALGLKEYHLKARDAERKLKETQANVAQVDALRREIKPHLKYLHMQAEKMKASESYSHKLDELISDYASREEATLTEMKKQFNKLRSPLDAEYAERSKKVKEIQGEIKNEEKEFSRASRPDDIRKDIEDLDSKRRALERELGRIEGSLSTQSSAAGSGVPAGVIMREVREAISFIDELMEKDSFEALKSGLKDIKVTLESIVKIVKGDGSTDAEEKLEDRKKQLTSELNSIDGRISEMRSRWEEEAAVREDIMVDLRAREHQAREEERALEEVQKKLREIEYEEQNYKTRQAEFNEFLKSKRVGTEQGGGNPFKDESERHSLMRNIERLKIKIEEAGGIDESVIKEYEDTVTRDAFLISELEDLDNARKSLENLMNELSHELESRFSHGLKQINEEFQGQFKNIFGGGKASLVYMKASGEDDENRGGIDISVDLPRKRIRSLDMLSGGERALTSVALLFAMSAVNPPPFLVLDETDAALDEANSKRYGDLLESLSAKTQLLVVTHNRETMRRAGVLYGITMGSDGVSRILSLKFDEAEEFAESTV